MAELSTLNRQVPGSIPGRCIMTNSAIIIIILLLIDITIKIWYARYFRNSAKFWQNHSEHWRRMFEEVKYGTKYDMPKNFNTAKDPFDVHFD